MKDIAKEEVWAEEDGPHDNRHQMIELNEQYVHFDVDFGGRETHECEGYEWLPKLIRHINQITILPVVTEKNRHIRVFVANWSRLRIAMLLYSLAYSPKPIAHNQTDQIKIGHREHGDFGHVKHPQGLNGDPRRENCERRWFILFQAVITYRAHIKAVETNTTMQLNAIVIRVRLM